MQKQLRYSKQRDLILKLLQSVTSHPTADWIYNELKQANPNLSLATVYRNLNLLSSTGVILKLDVGDGTDHYDATTAQHSHFFCEHCRRVIDINVPSALVLQAEAEKYNDISVSNTALIFYGLCKNCK